MTGIRTFLLIDEDSRHVSAFIDASLNSTDDTFRVECVKTFAAGIKRSRTKEVSAIFVNLSSPHSQGIEMFDKLLLAVPGVPILVLAGAKDAEIGLEALRRGAKDYLLQDHLDRDSFVLAIRNMTVRNSAEEMSYLKLEHAHFTLSSIRDAMLNPDIECTVTYVSHLSGKRSVRSGN